MGFVTLTPSIALAFLLACCGISEGSSSHKRLKSGSNGEKDLDLDGPITLEVIDTVNWKGGRLELRAFMGEKSQTVKASGSSHPVAGDGSKHLLTASMPMINPAKELMTPNVDSFRMWSGSARGAGEARFLDIKVNSATPISGIQIKMPSLNPADYERRVIGKTFNSTLSVDKKYNNTLFINCTFEGISNGNGMLIGDVSNVTIFNSTFKNISHNGILFSTKRGSRGVTIISNTFDNIGRNGIHATKRFRRNVDHTNLLIVNNKIRDVGTNGGELYHGIYTQSSGAKVVGNRITGSVDSNGISIRSDGIIWKNYVDIVSGRKNGSGIKYYSDHMTGASKTLIIADNVVIRNNLYSGVELNVAGQSIPKGIHPREWVVNNFHVLRNEVDARYDYVIEKGLKIAPWSRIELSGSPQTAASSNNDRRREPKWKVVP